MSDLVGNIIHKVLPEQHRWKMNLLANWSNIIGDLGDKVRIEKISSNFIVLGVCHPAWAQELYLFSDVLKKKINNVLKEDRIKYIRFKTVALEKSCKTCKMKTKQESTDVDVNRAVRLSEKQQTCLKQIKNEALRKLLVQYYGRCSVKK
jgi:hypothetical protein